MNKSELKSKLEASLEHLSGEFTKIRTGRATPGLIQDIPVSAYESTMTVKELGAISVPEPQTIVVSPWDKSLLKNIETAIRDSDLGVSPVTDGDNVRVSIPALTEERRKEYTKMVSTKVEECKNSMRNVRQEAMKDIEKSFSDKEIGEDEKFLEKEEVEKQVKEYVGLVEDMGQDKKDSLMQL